MIIVSFCLLLQRIFIQRIAFDIHQVAYKDRIDKSRMELEILDRLSEAVRGIGLVKAIKSITIREEGAYTIKETRELSTEKTKFKETRQYTKPPIPYPQLSIIMDQSPTDPDRQAFPESIEAGDPIKPRPSIFGRGMSSKGKILPEGNNEEQQQKPIHIEQEGEERLSIPTGSARQTVAGLAIGGYNKRKISLELFSDKNAEALAFDLFEKLRSGDQIFIGAIYRYFLNLSKILSRRN